jgi:hypothetical protein
VLGGSMRRLTGGAILAAALVVLLSALAGTAAAAPKVVHRRASFSFEAHLPSADGYALYLRAKNHRNIELDVEREGFAEPYVTMTYKVKGRVGEDGIAADLGRFGRVDLRFAGKPKTERFRHPNCTPRTPLVEVRGEMKGRFDFTSLDGKVKVETGRVEGETRRDSKRVCTKEPRREHFGSGFFAERPTLEEPRQRPSEEEELAVALTFLARAHTMGRTIDLYALGPPEEVIDLAATSTRRFGPVLLATTVHAPEPEAGRRGEEGRTGEDLALTGSGPRPTGATLTAPPPFSGSGTYSYEPGSPPTFLGSLEVRIPGEGTLPLAGPEFHAAICRFDSTKRQRACEMTVAPPHVV